MRLAPPTRFAHAATLRLLLAGAVVLLGYGLRRADSVELVVAFGAVVVTGILPAILWLRTRGAGMPIMPLLGLAHIPYYGLPILNAHSALFEFEATQILIGAVTVSLFLAVATLVTAMRSAEAAWRRVDVGADRVQNKALLRAIRAGLMVGCLFQLSAFVGLHGSLGAAFGVVRSIALTFLMIACYLVGVARARRILSGRLWWLCCALIAVNVLLTWQSLLLVTGIMFFLAAIGGFVITSGRIPIVAPVVFALLVGVLHSGKYDMRDEYWIDSVPVEHIGISRLPEYFVDWATKGVQRFVHGGDHKQSQSGEVLDRASLLHIIVLAQHLTPTSIPYLNGETYALLPRMLVPRFLQPNKPTSQAAMNLLNVRYGILSERETYQTAVGWGLIGEAYANFGFVGVILIAFVVGCVAGELTRRSVDVAPVSLPNLVAIAGLLHLLNMEGDFCGIFVSLGQSIVVIVAFFAIIRMFHTPVRGGPVPGTTSRPR